jgi:alkanesulfonate monooxygenase SsuD/methylene tetrahydromethanopterin reductase-like flavin-dependent oxidoreductase (luciferase family)
VITGRRGVAFTPMETRRDVMVRTARLADELGYELVAVPEGWGLDSTPVLTEIALATERIRLVSGVLSIWGRTPATLAMTAATLAEISGGRYVLGLGASTRALAEGLHDTPFEHAADRLATTVTAVRTLLAGEPAPLRTTRHARPLRLGLPPAPAVPVWLAALGPRALRVAAELADGWFPALVARDRLPALVGDLVRWGADDTDRPQSLTVAAGPLAVAGDDPGAAHDIAASCIAWYVCAMGDVYADSLARQGYAAEVAAIRAANPRPSPRSGVVPAAAQPLLDQLAVTGPPDRLRAQLARWDDVADVVVVGLAPGIPWPAIEATLRAAAPGSAAIRAEDHHQHAQHQDDGDDEQAVAEHREQPHGVGQQRAAGRVQELDRQDAGDRAEDGQQHLVQQRGHRPAVAGVGEQPDVDVQPAVLEGVGDPVHPAR